MSKSSILVVENSDACCQNVIHLFLTRENISHWKQQMVNSWNFRWSHRFHFRYQQVRLFVSHSIAGSTWLYPSSDRTHRWKFCVHASKIFGKKRPYPWILNAPTPPCPIPSYRSICLRLLECQNISLWKKHVTWQYTGNEVLLPNLATDTMYDTRWHGMVSHGTESMGTWI